VSKTWQENVSNSFDRKLNKQGNDRSGVKGSITDEDSKNQMESS